MECHLSVDVEELSLIYILIDRIKKATDPKLACVIWFTHLDDTDFPTPHMKIGPFHRLDLERRQPCTKANKSGQVTRTKKAGFEEPLS
jgi:hypothetical protein